MNITATSSNNAVSPSVSPSPSAAAAKTKDAYTTNNTAYFAEQTAAIYAQNAEFYTADIGMCASVYNGLTEERIQKGVAATRAKYGDDIADMELTAMEEARKDMARFIKEDDGALRTMFNVSGSTYTYDPQTDTYAAGAFTASANLDNSAVRYDSTKGPEISVMGSDFTSDFVRNYVPDTQYLPYTVDPEQLFDMTV